MCYFITVAFLQKEADAILASLPKGLHAVSTANPAITRLLPDCYVSYCVTDGMCSCDLFHSERSSEEKRQTDAMLRKYRKKGWSESKIQRALADHEKACKKTFRGFRDDVFEWINLTARNLSDPLLLFLHMYSGGVETEELRVDKAKIKIGELASIHGNFPEDTLVEFRVPDR